jgi:hypothetical protein
MDKIHHIHKFSVKCNRTGDEVSAIRVFFADENEKPIVVKNAYLRSSTVRVLPPTPALRPKEQRKRFVLHSTRGLVNASPKDRKNIPFVHDPAVTGTCFYGSSIVAHFYSSSTIRFLLSMRTVIASDPSNFINLN